MAQRSPVTDVILPSLRNLSQYMLLKIISLEMREPSACKAGALPHSHALVIPEANRKDRVFMKVFILYVPHKYSVWIMTHPQVK